ncbi:hypothetical protein PL10110_470118 [Planktothrix agardhii]|nr:hypothetical protein PL10110_470118 [Planktothrix agardhii]
MIKLYGYLFLNIFDVFWEKIVFKTQLIQAIAKIFSQLFPNHDCPSFIETNPKLLYIFKINVTNNENFPATSIPFILDLSSLKFTSLTQCT